MGIPFAEVIGDPVEHSKSPQMHNHWLRDAGIAARYRASQVRAADLGDFLETRRSDPRWRGCNVTIPHKEAVLEHLDTLTDAARAIGAVNCIVPRDGGLVGYNTDVLGIAAALDGITLVGKKVVLLGGGGAARAAVLYLTGQCVGEITVLVRNPERAEGLRLVSPTSALKILSLREAPIALRGAALIINASPLGMSGYPIMPPPLIEAVSNEPAAILFDMVYDPLETDFLGAGRSVRVGGIRMLVGQGVKAFELFFEASPPHPHRSVEALLA